MKSWPIPELQSNWARRPDKVSRAQRRIAVCEIRVPSFPVNENTVVENDIKDDKDVKNFIQDVKDVKNA